MKTVYLCSAFRNAAGYLDRYVEQVEGLQSKLAWRRIQLHLVLGYGDSTDGTDALLFEECAHRLSATLVDCTHGGPVFGPIVDAQRFKQLAYVGNKVWRHVPESADAVLWVESDLIWQPATLLRLIERLDDVPAVAPLVLDGPDSFYDVWGYVRRGVPFTKQRPFHPDLNGQLLQLDSAGSCVAVRGAYVRQLHFPETDVFRGFCRQLYAAGGSLWCDPACVVYHPA